MLRATFGAGCFWGVEKFFRNKFPELKSTQVGYVGGNWANPKYQEVCTGATGHAEAVQLEYDPKETKYRDLCRYFFSIHDPTTKDRQGNDIGTQYRSAIFYHDEAQQQEATKVKTEMQERFFKGTPISTEIVPAPVFWPAEKDHQRYLESNPYGYCNHKERFPINKGE
eukprot:TRINITY_DN22311_c0_g1_i1.p2 TRINITY_DN22311_c0_g1~~TRINITY_DN22311_c0_g1_i1.p2  ORF type:complete len:168 (-),score=46.86 TRINITY_DN22311_c0_g1_i1:16-519(-)